MSKRCKYLCKPNIFGVIDKVITCNFYLNFQKTCNFYEEQRTSSSEFHESSNSQAFNKEMASEPAQ
jgi:hypothetical protein